MDNLKRVTKEFDMKINVRNKNLMCISQKGNNNGLQVEQVSQLSYLNSLTIIIIIFISQLSIK